MLPFNDITSTIFYDQRIAISEPRPEPVVWACSKVEDMNVKGIARYTFKQDKFDQHTDYIEYDNDGKVIGIWCNWFDDSLTPADPVEPESTIYSEISYSGTKPEIKIGGSFKKFTVNFYKENEQINFRTGSWHYTIDNNDASSLLTIVTNADSSDVNKNQVKIKFNKDDKYIGKVLKIAYESIDGIKSEVEINIVGL